MAPDLPLDLKAAIDAAVHGRSNKEIARRAAILSANYRAGGGSQGIADPDDALAYAIVRLPATYAAVTAVFDAIIALRPDFMPRTLIDFGAGPGTASWAAAQQWPAIGQFMLVDRNTHLRDLATQLVAASAMPALRAAAMAQTVTGIADLVIAAYVVGEVDTSELPQLIERLLASTADTLVLVEPGTPVGFARIAALRQYLIAQGVSVLAPCPHDGPCPIVAPDWCHFCRRLPRSPRHRQIKGELSFEDEKFSYVVLTRDKATRARARVLSPPHVSKAGVRTRLCTAEGIVTANAARRDRDTYCRHKALRWGDAVPWPGK